MLAGGKKGKRFESVWGVRYCSRCLNVIFKGERGGPSPIYTPNGDPWSLGRT